MEKTFHLSYETVFKKCKEALRQLGIDVESTNKNNGTIQASTSASILSWGEDIEIVITSLSSGRTKVKVESEANAQFFSWGKDSQNERRILDKIDDLIRS